MIPEQNLVEYPVFAEAGTKVPPEEAKYSEGYVPADVLPAQHANWFFNKASDGITQLNKGLASVEKSSETFWQPQELHLQKQPETS